MEAAGRRRGSGGAARRHWQVAAAGEGAAALHGRGGAAGRLCGREGSAGTPRRHRGGSSLMLRCLCLLVGPQPGALGGRH